MANQRKVKIQSVLESQIPSFLQEDSPLFKEFLRQYYLSQEYETGVVDLSTNLTEFKNIGIYTNSLFHTEKYDCILTSDILSFDDELYVNSTLGFPEKYGLLKIDDEIITYSGITTNSFTGCLRGFSGISEIRDGEDSTSLTFSTTEASDHYENASVVNLNLIFYNKLFEKFKAQYLPDFEGRTLNEKIDLELILSRAKDFYLSKGTDISFRILFELLYDDKISVIKPRDFIVRSSRNNYLQTTNILVERINGTVNPLDLKGYTLFQNLPNGTTASASIYNVEYRPLDNLDLFEISLDPDSFIYSFHSTKKSTVVDILNNTIIVDSTIGFNSSGEILIKSQNLPDTYTTTNYSDKSANEFIGVNLDAISSISRNDVIIEPTLGYCIFDTGERIEFRIVNLIESFDYDGTSNLSVGDRVKLSSFGEDLSNDVKFNSWIYNYSTYHNIKSITPIGINSKIELHDSCKFYPGDIVDIIGGGSVETKLVNSTISNNIIVTDGINISDGKYRVIRRIMKGPVETSTVAGVQNTYLNLTNNSLVVASTGVPSYDSLENISDNEWKYELTKVGSATTSVLSTNKEHNLYSGNRIYLQSSQNEISSGEYFVKKISSTEISLFYSQSDLYKNLPIMITNSQLGTGIYSGYETLTKGAATQKILKEFISYNNFIEPKA